MKKFIIVSTQRTGSSALAEQIAMHPEITCGWEWIKDLPWFARISAADRALQGDFSPLVDRDQQHMREVFSEQTHALGFRWLFRCSDKYLASPAISLPLWLDRLAAFRKWVLASGDISIVHLQRDDNMDWLKSVYLAKQTSLYVGGRYPKGTKIYVPISKAVKRVKAKLYLEGQLRQFRDECDYFNVKYEEFSQRPQEVVGSIQSFLGFQPSSLQSENRIKKQSNKNVDEYIENYAELADELRRQGLLSDG